MRLSIEDIIIIMENMSILKKQEELNMSPLKTKTFFSEEYNRMSVGGNTEFLQMDKILRSFSVMKPIEEQK